MLALTILKNQVNAKIKMLDITSHVYTTERATTQFSEQNYLKHRLDHTETFIRLIILLELIVPSGHQFIVSESVNTA